MIDPQILQQLQRRFRGVIPILLALFFVGEARAEDRKPVTVITARQGTVSEQIAVVGTLMAREEIRVNPQVQGKEIRQILVEVGARVTAGQPLVVLDIADANLQMQKNSLQAHRAEAVVAQQRSKLDAAQVTEREARRLLERSRALQARGVVSEQILDERQSSYARAVSELEIARQTLALAKADGDLITRERDEIQLTLDRSIVRAPAAGLVLSRAARIGAMTSSSGEPLFTLAEQGDIEMEASVSETALVHLKEGMPAEVTPPGRLTPIKGRVRLNAARIDPATRMGVVRIDLVEEEGLIVGAFSRGTIKAFERTGILLPGTAVRRSGGKTGVYVAKDGIIIPRDVTVGLQQGNLLEITEGLVAGEQVVLKAGNALKAGDQIIAVFPDDPRMAAGNQGDLR